jgi:YidC/Oxa1 family membrane protein insertase
MNDQKNFLLAMALSALVFVAYFQFYVKPLNEQAQREAAQQEALAEQAPTVQAEPVVTGAQAREAAMAQSGTDARIMISSDALTGSFSLQGTRFDALTLNDYDKTLDPEDGKLVMLRPEGEDHAAYVFDNWVVDGGGSGVNAVWTQTGGGSLTPTTPVVIEHQGQGFKVTRTVSLNGNYLITLDDVVTNTSGSDVVIRRKGASRQHGLPEDLTNFFMRPHIVSKKPRSLLAKHLTQQVISMQAQNAATFSLT